MKPIAQTIAVFAMFIFTAVSQAEEANVEIPTKNDFHLFLLAGQSNMAGRGEIEAEDNEIFPRVLTLSKDESWRLAVDPLHYDLPTAGVGPGKMFGKIVADSDSRITVGLIPAAVGGSPISSWEPGGYFEPHQCHPYDDAIRRAKIAMQQGKLKAILWHQGESDCEEKLAPEYQAKLEQLIKQFRADLGDLNLPVIIGQLGHFDGSPWNRYTEQVNAAQIAVAKKMHCVAFVTSEGLTPKSDKEHFDTRSARELGKRYADAYLKLQSDSVPSISNEKP